MDKIFAEVEAKPTFKKYRFVELLAESDTSYVGRYRNVVFVLTHHELSLEPLDEIEVVFGSGEKEFRFGKYTLNDELVLETEFKEDLMLDCLPALLAEIAVAKTLVKECIIRANQMSEEERKIVKEVARLSEEAKSLSPAKLEELSFEVLKLRNSFFSGYMRYKDTVKEVFSSITRASRISILLGNMLSEKLSELRAELENLRYFESIFEQTLAGVRDAFNVVHLRLEMLRDKEGIEIQRRTSALQAAAAVIEFVAVYYYTMKIWQTFLPVERLPNYLSFTLLATFTTLVVLCTEVLGRYISDRKVTGKLILVSSLLALNVLLMIVLPLISLGA